MGRELIKGRNLLCKVNVEDIAFINAIFEWYHEIGTVRTRDRKEGIIEIWASPYFFEEVLKALDYLKKGGYVDKLEIVGETDDWWKE